MALTQIVFNADTIVAPVVAIEEEVRFKFTGIQVKIGL